jgi:hypothetical protein
MESKAIKIGRGIDAIEFGMSRQEVLAILGEPDEKNKISYSVEDPDYFSEEWHYDGIEMSLVFDMLDTLELTTISISSDAFTLVGEAIIGKDESELMRITKKAGIDDNWEELEEEDPIYKTFTHEGEGVSLYFENGLLSEFQWEML